MARALTTRLIGQYHLRDAAAVAQQQERDLCQLPLMVEPARNADSLPNVCRECGRGELAVPPHFTASSEDRRRTTDATKPPRSDT
jgi:hypothetical protein